MLNLKLSDVISAIGANTRSEFRLEDLTVSIFPPVSIDTRTLAPGEAFFAIRGARLNGHSYIPEAVAKGASIIVHSEPVQSSRKRSKPVYLRVDDTTSALQELASLTRQEWGQSVIALTGSMGKTTTRHFIASLAAARFDVLETPGNFNNHIGLPLSLLSLERHHNLAVLELGMNHAGEIKLLSEICRPDLALITNVAPVHTEFFGGVEEIAEAKAEILESLSSKGVFIYNGDDRNVTGFARRHQGRCVSFGFGPQNDYRVVKVAIQSIRSMQLWVDTPGGGLCATLPFVGDHYAYNVVAAIAAAIEAGTDIETIRKSLAALTPLGMRGEIYEYAGITIWDDSYNSNPKALESLLKTVAQLGAYDRKILVLGDMLELGDESRQRHHDLGLLAGQTKPDLLITVGKDARYMGEAAEESGLETSTTVHFDDAASAGDFLAGILKTGDFVFVKGSRGVKLNETVDRLRGVLT